MTPALEIRHLRHAFGPTGVLHDLDLDVPAGSRNLEIKPYAISGLRTDRTARPASRCVSSR